MNEYELCVIFSGQQTQEEIDETAKQVEALLTGASAEVKFNHSLGRKKMTYKIKDQTHGEYRCWLFLAESENIPELNEKLRLSQFIVRHLITRFENTTIEDRITKIKEAKGPKVETDEEEETTQRTDKADDSDKKEEVKEEEKVEEKKPSSKEPKISLDQLDEKLDELLESDKL